MASAREERMQHRLRGAQRRQVKDVDFGLSFPAPPTALQPAIATRRTSPDIPPPPSSIRQNPSRGRGRPSNANLLGENKNRDPVIHTTSNANISAKRRKLDSDEAPSSSTRSTRSSLHIPRNDIYALPDDVSLPPTESSTKQPTLENTLLVEEAGAPIITSGSTSQTTRTQTLSKATVEGVTEFSLDNPSSGHRLHVGFRVARPRSSTSPDSYHASTPTSLLPPEVRPTSLRTKRKVHVLAPKQAESVKKGARHAPRGQKLQGADDVDDLSLEQPDGLLQLPEKVDELHGLSPERLRRPLRPHRDNGVDLSSFDTPKKRDRRDSTNGEDRLYYIDTAMVDLVDEAEGIDDQEAARIMTRNRSRRISTILHESPDLNKGTVVQATIARRTQISARKDSNSTQHNRKKRQRNSPQPIDKLLKTPDVRIRSPIPITVHRITKKHAHHGNENSDDHKFDLPHSKRIGVNAIDVFSQMCQEIIGSGLATLEAGRVDSQQSALRREYSTKLRAIEAFRNELQTRLIDHTSNLDSLFSLGKRVRNERRRKLALREEILQIRSQREHVAHRVDEIRIAHENASKTTQQRGDLSITIYDIEFAIESGRADAPGSSDKMLQIAGMELLLRHAAGQVSSKSMAGGILHQAKGFNSFLERAALALEHRKL